jgi:hypothetical protein
VWVLPAGAGAVTFVFAALVGIRWIRRRRPHQAAWAAALLMFAIASFAAAAGMVWGWNAWWFRSYYLFGAIINVPFLAAGTIYLLGPRPLGHIFAVLCTIAAIFAAGVVISTPLDLVASNVTGIPAGSEVWGPSALPRDLSRYYSYMGFGIVVAGALWSAWRLARNKNQDLRPLVTGNVLIAVGTTLVAAAGSLARFGQGVFFAVGLLAGAVVMFIGFLKTGTGRPAEPAMAAEIPPAVPAPADDTTLTGPVPPPDRSDNEPAAPSAP